MLGVNCSLAFALNEAVLYGLEGCHFRPLKMSMALGKNKTWRELANSYLFSYGACGEFARTGGIKALLLSKNRQLPYGFEFNTK